jgi:gamma-glutamylputrescine oxidase
MPSLEPLPDMTPEPHAPSWYAASANAHAPFPPLRGDTRCDVLVVGAGYTGLSTAIELRQRGFDVVVAEAQRVGWGASGRNGGHVVTGFNKSLATIAGWVGREDARRLWQLSEEAKDILRDRVAAFGIACDLRWGYLFAALKHRHLADLAATLAEWRAHGYGAGRLLSRDEMQAAVAAPAYLGGLFDGGSGQLHPLNYALGLAEACRGLGVRLYEDTLVRRIEAGEPAMAITRHGRITARHVALAGNAYLPGLSPAIDHAVRSRIMPARTYMLATEPIGPERARVVIPSGHAVADVNFVLNYYRLSADKRMLFGGGVSYSARDMPGTAERLRRTMVRCLPSLADAKVDYFWGGEVAISLNRVPSLGRAAPNIFYAQGYSGHGVLLTGIAGRVMAEAIAGQAERFDVFARIPHRPFPGGRLFRVPALVLAMTWYRMRDTLG